MHSKPSSDHLQHRAKFVVLRMVMCGPGAGILSLHREVTLLAHNESQWYTDCERALSWSSNNSAEDYLAPELRDKNWS